MERRGLRTEEYRVTPTHKTNIFLSLPEKVLIKFVSTEKLTYLASLTSKSAKTQSTDGHHLERICPGRSRVQYQVPIF